MNIIVSQNVIDAVPWIVSTLKKMGFPRLAVENCKTGIVSAIMGHFRNLNANMPGYCYYDIPGQKYRLIFRYRMSKDRTKALLTSVSTAERQLHEQKRDVVRLTESDLVHCVKEVALMVLNEVFDSQNKNEIEGKEPFTKEEYPYLSDTQIERLNKDWPKIQNFTYKEWKEYFLPPYNGLWK